MTDAYRYTIYLEDRRGAVFVVKNADGRFEGLWQPPSVTFDEDVNAETAKDALSDQISSDIDLYPFRKELDYDDYTSIVLKGRAFEEVFELRDAYTDQQWVTYDSILNLDLAGHVEADLTRLSGDFFQAYEEY